MANRIVSVHAGIMEWGYMRLCCHLVGSRSFITPLRVPQNIHGHRDLIGGGGVCGYVDANHLRYSTRCQ